MKRLAHYLVAVCFALMSIMALFVATSAWLHRHYLFAISLGVLIVVMGFAATESWPRKGPR